MIETVFVTGGSGFIGREFVIHALTAGYHVLALSRSERASNVLRSLGATPVPGDLLQPNDSTWREYAESADAVVHLAQPPTFGAMGDERITRARVRNYRADRLTMDANLLDALKPEHVQRVIYVSGTSYYGEQGSTLRDETTTPNPRGFGPYIVEALAQLERYKARLPILEAYPGGVYGSGSWFARILKALRSGEPVVRLSGPARYGSSIHVEDCGRAIVHLLEHGAVGERYFLVDDLPAPNDALIEAAAKALGVGAKRLNVPYSVVSLLVGRTIAESMAYENRLSNAKLKATGFTFNFPTYETGVPDVVWRYKNRE